jgi:acetyltransferase-like isoleucine patch superfamily enzyme
MGKNIYFMGFPKFSNKPGGKIVIGDDCTFLSNRTANMIGINRPCIISTQKAGAVVIIGSKCGFSGTVIGSFVSIRIEDNVRCGANTLITDSDWHLDDPRSGLPSPVLIGKNVWIGEGVKILKGVNIGENSLVGAGSVVVKSIPPNVIAAGNPCEVIRKLK